MDLKALVSILLFSSLTMPTWKILSGSAPPFFPDDLAAVLAGRIGVKFTDQCIDLERRLRKFLDNLEFYSLLTLQPINYKKTEAMWSSRSPMHPVINLRCGSESIR